MKLTKNLVAHMNFGPSGSSAVYDVCADGKSTGFVLTQRTDADGVAEAELCFREEDPIDLLAEGAPSVVEVVTARLAP